MIKIASHFFYGYQGQEKSQNDVNWDNFELRTYNHDLGRWSAPDPYGQFHSPYLAMGNDPVNNIDPDGGFMNASQQGMQQRELFMKFYNDEQKYLQVIHAGKYSQNYIYASYKEAFDDLTATYYSGSKGESSVGDVSYLNAVYELNNEYIGMGLASDVLGSGVYNISEATRSVHSDLVERNQTQNGNTGTYSAADAVTAHPLNFDAQADMYSNNAFNASSKEVRLGALEKSRAKAQAEYVEKQKSKVEESGSNSKRWFPGNHVVNNGQTIQDGQGSTTTNPSITPIVLTVFGAPGSAGPMGGGANFSNNHPEVFMLVQYINLLAPDAGNGTNYSFTFLDFATLGSATFNQFVPSQPKNNGLNAVVTLPTPFTFGNLGGTITVSVQNSNMFGNVFDACWGADIYYTNWKR